MIKVNNLHNRVRNEVSIRVALGMGRGWGALSRHFLYIAVPFCALLSLRGMSQYKAEPTVFSYIMYIHSSTSLATRHVLHTLYTADTLESEAGSTWLAQHEEIVGIFGGFSRDCWVLA